MFGVSEPPSTSGKIRYHQPYFTPMEVAYLTEKQRGKLSETQEERVRQQSMSFIDVVGTQMGFPRKTIATAQTLYNRFHLFFPLKEFAYHEVATACLYVSTKLHDTLKKPRDILMASYVVRIPELAARINVVGGEPDVSPNQVEADKKRMLSIERLVLEMICFNFNVRPPFSFVIKLGKALGATKDLIKLAWHLAVDCHRTLVPLMYPPHTIALACVYLAALLTSFETPAIPASDGSMHRTSHELAALLGGNGEWEATYQARVEDLEDIVHLLIDLLQTMSSNFPNSLTASPNTPSSPSPYSFQPLNPNNPNNLPLPFSSSASLLSSSTSLTRLKIALKEREHEPRERMPLSQTDPTAGLTPGSGDGDSGSGGSGNVLGKNEGTVRFLFSPPGSGPPGLSHSS